MSSQSQFSPQARSAAPHSLFCPSISPCIFVVVLFASVGLFVCMSMDLANDGLEKTNFIAPGTLRHKIHASLPTTFWKLNPHGEAYWNQLQLLIDRNFSPILHPKFRKNGFENTVLSESLLRQSFFEASDLTNMTRNFDEMPQKIQDFVSNMDKRDYPTVIQPDGVCGAGAKDEKGPPLLLLVIKTTESNFKNRQAIRQTWGEVGWVAGQNGSSSGGYVRRVFLLGKESQEELGVDLSELLEQEGKHFGDILQWDFQDTFFNLTLKDVHFWSWFSRFCGQTRFIFKGDDDVFVNTPKLITYLQDQLQKPQAHGTMPDFMVGDVIGAAFPNRMNNSKYYIPDSFYKGLYPAYAGGGGVVYSGLLSRRLHDVSKRVHLFPIDDVYVGMCMNRLEAYPVHHPAFLTFDFPEKEANELCSYHRVLLVHKRSPSQLVRVWSHMKETQTQCSNVTLRE
ncbi:hypothetical protein Q5P01_009321 [Channa striata]|uniref:Hexosyltransferase n=1 Tax=Channa striata TaxID=64152 RepID=A0AA88N144_CHASR|nr:hypothetical protein Q5P01_009321 [Channa striata]